jgi:hypothetical protein
VPSRSLNDDRWINSTDPKNDAGYTPAALAVIELPSESVGALIHGELRGDSFSYRITNVCRGKKEDIGNDNDNRLPLTVQTECPG